MEKRINKSFHRLLAMLLCLAMLVPQILVPGLIKEARAESATPETQTETIVIAGSDFQPENDTVATGVSQMEAILAKIKADYQT